MTTKPKPGNQPDPADMAGPAAEEGAAADPSGTHPTIDEEEEAARLGDFA